MAFVKRHQPCPICGSSDAASINENGSAKCFSCEEWMANYENPNSNYTQAPRVEEINNTNVVHFSKDDYVGIFSALSDRSIKEETAKRYNVRVVLNTDGSLKEHYYPYYKNNELCGYKVRKIKDKKFYSQGKINDAELFGQSVCQPGGKYVTLTEGECDAMAAYELTGSRWPCVSIRNGASSATTDVKNNLEFLESFENVIICFDNDKVGKEAAAKVAALFRPNKAKIMTLPSSFKDPNDMLRQGAYKEFTEAFWQSSTYTPSGILRVSEKLYEWQDRSNLAKVSYPWEGLNNKLFGLRAKELVVLAGGTGLGKSALTRELSHWILNNSEDNIGIVALEEDWRRTVDGLLSIEANAKLHLEEVRNNYTEEELKDVYQKVLGEDRVFVHAHFGVNEIDEVLSKLRYMIVGCDCKWIVIDHLHMFISGSEERDERKAIDSIMLELRKLCEETGACMILVSHLNRGHTSEGHENGAEVRINNLRGSHGIAHIADCIIALERNQQSENEIESKTTRLRVLKSRYTGDVGMAAQLLYDDVTGRLIEVPLTNPDNSLEFDDIIPF